MIGFDDAAPSIARPQNSQGVVGRSDLLPGGVHVAMAVLKRAVIVERSAAAGARSKGAYHCGDVGRVAASESNDDHLRMRFGARAVTSSRARL